jgi:ABC-type multidrug transport system fused ATPase/permease subunit
LSGQAQSRLREQLLDSFLRTSWSEKSKEKEGHLQELMGAQTAQAGLAVIQVTSGLAAGLMFLTLCLSAFVLSPRIAALVLATAIVLFAGLRPLSRRVRRSSASTASASLAASSGVAELVRVAEEVDVFGVAEATQKKLSQLFENVRAHYVRTKTLSGVVPVVYQSAVILLVLGGLGLLYAVGVERLASLGAVVLILIRASAYGQQLQTAYQGLGESMPYLDSTLGAIDRYRRNATSFGNLRPGPVRTVRFVDVSFEYRPGSRVLTDLTFEIRDGEMIGIIGPTGAGKSTLATLLTRLYSPSQGSYQVNGGAAPGIDRTDWCREVAYLPQTPSLLNGTVEENVRFRRDSISSSTVREACRLAHVDADIASLKNGYQTVIGQGGDGISGGQRQRLCLARALAGHPSLLILDEPTSALDPQSEKLIQQSLEGLHGSLTMVVVAHRLSTLALCDRVMVLEDGSLQAFAAQADLYASNDFYRRAADLSMARPRV